MAEFDTMPVISDLELCKVIEETVDFPQYLFFRKMDGHDDLEWLLGAAQKGYECFCTACREHFVESFGKIAASSWTSCPRCGQTITPKQWRQTKVLKERRFQFSLFQRGDGDAVWLLTFHCYGVPNFGDIAAGLPFSLYEKNRILFTAGSATRWKKAAQYWLYDAPTFEKMKSVSVPEWISGFACYPDYYAEPRAEELAGSCLQYARVPEFMYRFGGHKLAQYLTAYVKHPMLEGLWLRGLEHWLRDLATREFSEVVNLRAKKPERFFRGFSKGEIKLLARGNETTRIAAVWKRLQNAGVCTADEKGLAYAKAVNAAFYCVGKCEPEQLKKLRDDCGVDGKTLRKYIERQGKRTGLALHLIFRDLMDYHSQMERLQITGGEMLPDDLQRAHERLSERERALKSYKLNAQFRIRRRLLRGCCKRGDGLLIRPVDSENEIIREGERQNNCVAGYAKRHAEGRTNIFLLRRTSEPKRNFVTVEVSADFSRIVQARTYRNGGVPEEVNVFLAEWIKEISNERINAKH